MKILTTGGAGFIGSNLALKLDKLGHNVVILDNLSEQIHGKDLNKSYTYNLVKDKFEFIRGNVLDSDILDEALDGVDIVVHLAAETGTGQSMYEVEKYVNSNIGGTALLLDKLVNNKTSVKKLVVASSRAIYGEGKFECANHGIVYPVSRLEEDMDKKDFNVKCPICHENVKMLPTSEDSLAHPTSVYGYTKKAQEDLCMMIGKSINIPVVALRFQNVYGPGQSLKNPYTGILSIFSTQIKNNNDINVFEDGKETRDFVYIEDVTDAIVLAILKEEANYEVLNVGSNELVDVYTVAQVLKEKYNSNINIEISGNYRLGDIRENMADLTKINTLLGYKPKVKFKEGISNFIDWVEQQQIEVDNYSKTIKEMKDKGLYK